MLTVTVGKTNKRINSTSQTISDSTDLSCRLKEPTSMQSPVFIVQGLNKMQLYNFCKFENRYYFIDDIVYVTTDIQELHCHLDPLATFKGAIENTYAYVTYGPSGSKNVWVDDRRFGPDWKLGASAGSSFNLHSELDIGINSDFSDWSVVIVVQCAEDNVASGFRVYGFNVNYLQDILTGYANVPAQDIAGLSTTQQLLMYFAEMVLSGGAAAMDNIRSAVLLPVSIDLYKGSSVTNMQLGPYDWIVPSNIEVYNVSPFTHISYDGEISLERGVLSTLPNNKYYWLNLPKYCTIEVSHPNGYMDINDIALIGNNKIYWYSEITPMTGDYIIRFTSEQGKANDTVAMISGNLGVDIMGLIPGGVAIGFNVMNMMYSNAASALGEGMYFKKTEATENKNLSTPVADSNGDPTKFREYDKGVKSKNTTEVGTTGISGSFNPGANCASSRGASFGSGFCGLCSLPSGKITVDIEYFYPGIFNTAMMTDAYEDYCDKYGYPVNRYLKLGNLSGYIECAGASVEGALGANNSNKATINSHLNNGFYLE